MDHEIGVLVDSVTRCLGGGEKEGKGRREGGRKDEREEGWEHPFLVPLIQVPSISGVWLLTLLEMVSLQCSPGDPHLP